MVLGKESRESLPISPLIREIHNSRLIPITPNEALQTFIPVLKRNYLGPYQRRMLEDEFDIRDLLGKSITDVVQVANTLYPLSDRDTRNPNYFTLTFFDQGRTILLNESWGDPSSGHAHFYLYDKGKIRSSTNLFLPSDRQLI